MFTEFESLILETFTIRGKKERSLKEVSNRLEKRAIKRADKARSAPAKFVVDGNGNPITNGGTRQFASDCAVSRREAVERLAKAYSELEGKEVSPFGEYVEKEGFFESESEVVEVSPPIVEVNESKFYQNAVKFLREMA